MPLYEYRCQSCGTTFEVIQKFSDEPLECHEGCGGAVERLVSAAALQFKGSGWYITDYARSSGSGKENGEGKAPASGDGASSEKSAKPDSAGASKPETKTEAKADSGGAAKK